VEKLKTLPQLLDVATDQLNGGLKTNITIAFMPPAPAEALSDEVAATFVSASPTKKSSRKGKGKKG
jgi:hypothetical protein